jgi:GT2 family glycosyltransferase/glycosyltransferase involved in cell wall biosynthesis
VTSTIADAANTTTEDSIRQENMRLRAELTVLDAMRIQFLAETAERERTSVSLWIQLDKLTSLIAWRCGQVLLRLGRRIPARLRPRFIPAPPEPVANSATLYSERPPHARYFGAFAEGMAKPEASPWYDPQTPRVSIIILNWNRSEMTLACVHYVLRHTQGHRFEIIIADNGSSPDEVALLTQSGLPVRVLALGTNRYFGEANNIAAEQARGEYLFFLNNDAFVHAGWLGALIDTIERLPHAGAVGCRLIYLDGALQEAGALVSWDGFANQLGKRSAPADAEKYASLRQVDYVSAAAVLVRRQDFQDVLGFDLCWEPAYFEDVDLCLKLRTIGKATYYCPNAIVTHVENATSLDPRHNLQLDNVVEVNRITFTSRWGDYLLGSPPKITVAAPPYRPAALGSGRKRVALYTPFTLTPGGGERYLLSVAQALAFLADVTLVTEARCSVMRLQQVGMALQLDVSALALATLDEALAGPAFDLAFVIGNAVLPSLPGLGRRNIYICQFPFPMLDLDAVQWRPNWDRFERVIVYSDYARGHFETRRDDLHLPPGPQVQTITPPVRLLAPATGKKRMILSVGRFFAGHHCKRQDLMVEAVRQLVADGIECELHLAGSLRPEPEHRAYYLSVVNAAKDLPVVIHPNIDPAALAALYAESSVYWHLTGMETDVVQAPERSEHFGIAIVEAMSAGCVPVAFNNGGPTEIIDPGRNGYLVDTLPQLVECTRTILADPALAQNLGAHAVIAAARYDEAAFAKTVQELAGEMLS